MGGCFRLSSTPPSNLWSQNTAKIRFLGQRAGGLEQLKDRKIVHVYRDDDYGRETLPILDRQAAHYGFAVQHLAVPPPGLDQKATWLRVKVAQPDWVILRSGGAMTPTALKEAAQVGVPRDKIVGQTPPRPPCHQCALKLALLDKPQLDQQRSRVEAKCVFDM
jgi:Periplasmic binding protein